MILGTGIDIVETRRIADSLERFGDRFLKRIFHDAEAAYARSMKKADLHLAARFAAKEAASKALGTGIAGGVGWTQIEVVQPGGRVPTLRFTGVAQERLAAIGATRSHLSLSHDAGLAVACVVLED